MLNYHKASKLEPDNTDYLLHLGMALHIAGKRSHAQTVYLEVLRREPKNADAVRFLHSLREAGSIEPEGSEHD